MKAKKVILAILAATVVTATAAVTLTGCNNGDASSYTAEDSPLEGSVWDVTQAEMDHRTISVSEYMAKAGMEGEFTVTFKDGKAIARMGDKESVTDYGYYDGKVLIEGYTYPIKKDTLVITVRGQNEEGQTTETILTLVRRAD